MPFNKSRGTFFAFFLFISSFISLVSPESLRAEDALINKIKLSGDLRLRSEYEENKGFNDEAYRWRQRIRLRLGAAADVSDNVDVGLRLSTGDKTYQSTANQTLDGKNFEKFDLTLDRAYARYRNDFGPANLSLYGGKFGHTFWTPTEVLWSSDLQPQGVAESVDIKGTGLTLNLAQYVIRQADRNDVPGGTNNGNELYGGQVLHKGEFGGAGTKVALSYYSVADSGQLGLDAKASNAEFTTNKNFNTCTGTVTSPCTGEVSDFRLLNLSAEASFLKDTEWPVKVIGEYVKNIGAKSFEVNGNSYGKEDTAWLIGVGAGKTDPGSLSFWISYSQIEADSVVANFNSSDLQQTNVNTISPKISYQITKNTSVFYDGYYQERNNFELAKDNGNCTVGGTSNCSDTTQYRHRINLLVNF